MVLFFSYVTISLVEKSVLNFAKFFNRKGKREIQLHADYVHVTFVLNIVPIVSTSQKIVMFMYMSFMIVHWL